MNVEKLKDYKNDRFGLFFFLIFFHFIFLSLHLLTQILFNLCNQFFALLKVLCRKGKYLVKSMVPMCLYC